MIATISMKGALRREGVHAPGEDDRLDRLPCRDADIEAE